MLERFPGVASHSGPGSVAGVERKGLMPKPLRESLRFGFGRCQIVCSSGHEAGGGTGRAGGTATIGGDLTGLFWQRR